MVVSLLFSCNSVLVLGGGYCGFHSFLCHLLLLSVGGTFVGGFSLAAGILVFTAPTYFFMWSVGGKDPPKKDPTTIKTKRHTDSEHK